MKHWIAVTAVLASYGAASFLMGWHFGAKCEIRLHQRLTFKELPWTYLRRVKDSPEVECFDDAKQIDCRSWLAKHFEDVCAWGSDE